MRRLDDAIRHYRPRHRSSIPAMARPTPISAARFATWTGTRRRWRCCETAIALAPQSAEATAISASSCTISAGSTRPAEALRDGARLRPRPRDGAAQSRHAAAAGRRLPGGVRRIRMAPQGRAGRLCRRAPSPSRSGRARTSPAVPSCSMPSRAWATRCSSAAFVPEVEARGARVVLQVQRPLVALLATSFPSATSLPPARHCRRSTATCR